MLKAIRRQQPTGQRGLTLLGLLFWAIVVAAIVIVGAKAVPSVSEYRACIKGVELAARESTPDAARAAFDRYASSGGYITTITSSDLDVTPSGNGNLTVSFAYNKEIQLVGPVYLLIKYKGSSNSSKYD